MPQYVVTYTGGVAIYQADHPKAKRTVDQLPVLAGDPASAYFHAARVTQGGIPQGVYDRAGRRVWGEGPDTLALAITPPPQVESILGEKTEVYGG